MGKFKFGDKLVLKAYPHRCRILTYKKYEGKDSDGIAYFSCLEDRDICYTYDGYMKYNGNTQIIGNELCSI